MDAVVGSDTRDGGVRLVLYRDEDGTVPFVRWMESIPSRARAKVYVRLEMLATRWYAIRRGHDVVFPNGMHELCVRHSGVGYYLYYFRFGLGSAVLVGGLAASPRSRRVDAVATANERKRLFEDDPRTHTFVPVTGG